MLETPSLRSVTNPPITRRRQTRRTDAPGTRHPAALRSGPSACPSALSRPQAQIQHHSGPDLKRLVKRRADEEGGIAAPAYGRHCGSVRAVVLGNIAPRLGLPHLDSAPKSSSKVLAAEVDIYIKYTLYIYIYTLHTHTHTHTL